MSLYLTMFDGSREIMGFVFGHYSDFGYFRDRIASTIGRDEYPVLMQHSDCDGEWSVSQLEMLKHELRSVASEFKALPPEEPTGAFEHTAQYRRGARSLFDCFHTVDGQNIFEAMIALCDEGMRLSLPVLFQ
jgi:hypothetical protein